MNTELERVDREGDEGWDCIAAYDVLIGGKRIGRIFRKNGAPRVGRQYWTAVVGDLSFVTGLREKFETQIAATQAVEREHRIRSGRVAS